MQERCLWFLMTLSIANTTFEGKRGVICDIVIIICAKGSFTKDVRLNPAEVGSAKSRSSIVIRV